MVQGQRPGGYSRPKTAATTNKLDESRIKDKLKYLESIEMNIENDIQQILDTKYDPEKEKRQKEG